MNGRAGKSLIGIGIATTIAIALLIDTRAIDMEVLAIIFFLGGIATILVGIIVVWISSQRQHKAQGIETACVEKVLDFYCNNVQLSQGRAFKKYQWYLSEITNFLIKYPKYKNFRNDLKFVFEMSQDDSRLTPKEKQEIANEFTSNYKKAIKMKRQRSYYIHMSL